jgi:hypothetical protein
MGCPTLCSLMMPMAVLLQHAAGNRRVLLVAPCGSTPLLLTGGHQVPPGTRAGPLPTKAVRVERPATQAVPNHLGVPQPQVCASPCVQHLDMAVVWHAHVCGL